MSGGKGGSTTSQVEIPQYIQDAARRNLDKADYISQIGYTPYYGPDVAAFTPMQQAGFQNTADLAGAFGMAAPDSQRGVMGGMAAPTTYANGVQGYSSQPMYQQSLDAFREDRPGQASYIDSLFIDPVSGESTYQPAIPRPVAQPASGGGGGSNDFSPSPRLPSNFYNSPMGGPAPSVDLPGNVVTRALNVGAGRKDSSGNYAGKKDDGTVMCTAYCEMGYLPKEIWALDRRYGVKMYREDPTLIEGYHMWGVPVANYLRKQTVGAKVARAIMWPVVKAWAEEMAHNMKPEKYAPNYIGKAIKFIGEPFSRMCGKLKSRKIEEMA